MNRIHYIVLEHGCGRWNPVSGKVHRLYTDASNELASWLDRINPVVLDHAKANTIVDSSLGGQYRSCEYR